MNTFNSLTWRLGMLPKYSYTKKYRRNVSLPPNLFLLISFFYLLASQALTVPPYLHAAEQPTATPDATQLPETFTKDEVAGLLAELSDKQVRLLLIDELHKNAEMNEEEVVQIGAKGPGAFINNILQTLSNETEESENEYAKLWDAAPNVIPDLKKVFIQLCPYGTSHGAMINVLWVFLFIGIGLTVEWTTKRWIIKKHFSFDLKAFPQLGSLEKLSAGIIKELPDIIGLFVFLGSSFFSFVTFIGTDSPYVQLFFLAILVSISAIRILTITSHIIFSPSIRSFRVIPIICQAARTFHYSLIGAGSYIVCALTFSVVAKRLGAEAETFLLLQLFFATLLLLITAIGILLSKNRIKSHIISSVETDVQTWGRTQFANVWHLLALLYLFLLWLLLLNDLSDPDVRNKGAFLLSFFVVPIWVIADRIIQWMVAYFLDTLKIYQHDLDPSVILSEEELEQRKKGKKLYLKTNKIARAGVVVAFIIWVAELWDMRIPFISNLAAVTLDALIIMTITLFFWQFISAWIERKIQESLPEEEEDTSDDEWGGASARGRSYTLLPMIRKFIGTCLVVMVTMMVLSSMGVDIGPLLAGAGVIGLALGFGAQKLVADMFSGFFYLLDDAFRVGEYLQAGTVSGTVESISLRNVMLRHHRGMLQIVPHSELGAITNYMRGGIVVKFNLDFPYDADIDKIRKIIKKVGIAMLEHEEYGKDFIRPVKSQGVREITNSVMTIRVKFTAEPGKHFVIRREAYRRVTEALNAKGIHYAHRKVIVDLPQPEANEGDNLTEQQEKIKQAAGAAAQRAIEQEEEAAKEASQETKPTMPGM